MKEKELPLGHNLPKPIIFSTMNKQILFVAGGRDFNDWELFEMEVRGHSGGFINEIVSGDCKTGADSFAKIFAKKGGWLFTEFEADWNKHGKVAGPIRN